MLEDLRDYGLIWQKKVSPDNVRKIGWVLEFLCNSHLRGDFTPRGSPLL